jgi:membrane protein DedA with SNARE-associated domain
MAHASARLVATAGRRRLALLVAGLLVLVVAAVVVLNRLGGFDAFSLSPTAGVWTYLAMAAMVFGDAICPVLPGETTLNAGSTLAAEGHLDLGLVISAGTVGAVVGDSTLYWVARLAKRRVQPQIERAEKDDRVALALSYLRGNAPLLIVAGRYVPGLRFVVNATMGVTDFPYLRFLRWSALGGLLWATYTCLLAYLISTALAGYPLASVVISSAVTMAAVALVALRMRRKSPG